MGRWAIIATVPRYKINKYINGDWRTLLISTSTHLVTDWTVVNVVDVRCKRTSVNNRIYMREIDPDGDAIQNPNTHSTAHSTQQMDNISHSLWMLRSRGNLCAAPRTRFIFHSIFMARNGIWIVRRDHGAKTKGASECTQFVNGVAITRALMISKF